MVGVHSLRAAPLPYPSKWCDVDQRNGGVDPDQSLLDGEWELATAAMCLFVVISFKRAALCFHSLNDTIRPSLVLHVHVMSRRLTTAAIWETRGFRFTAANTNSLTGEDHLLTYYRSLKAGESEL
jgi:hypothetical protein